jgi:carbamoyltransferase
LEALASYKQFIYWEERSDFLQIAAEEMAEGKILGWFQGRSEFGNRALGNRSILADPSKECLREELNKIKGRESFRPFSPSILVEHLNDYYDLNTDSPYMNQVGFATDIARKKVSGVIHVDGSSRLQTVSKYENEIFHALITEFHKITNIPLVANTSFNYNGEPIVESPFDAIRSFLSMDIDLLVMDQYIIRKRRK